jgi:hypothetical protein
MMPKPKWWYKYMMDYGMNDFKEFEKQYKKIKQTMKVEKKEVVCIRLPESIKKKVDAEAKKMYLAPSKLVSIIVQKYYEKL